MMKPGMLVLIDRFKKMLRQVHKKRAVKNNSYPVFLSLTPPSDKNTRDMLQSCAMVKKNVTSSLDQVQTFYPSPMANATTTVPYKIKNPISIKVDHKSEIVEVP